MKVYITRVRMSIHSLIEAVAGSGAPRRSRTPNLLIRSQALYPIELWARYKLTVDSSKLTDP